MFSVVVVVFCVGSGPCDELVTSSEESYRLCVCVILCDIQGVPGEMCQTSGECSLC